MIPRFIRSYTEFQDAVQLGSTTESLVLEFKEKIDSSGAYVYDVKQKAQKETCRDISQFTNTFGGCLLIGVEEEDNPTHRLKVAKAIKPLANARWIKAVDRAGHHKLSCSSHIQP